MTRCSVSVDIREMQIKTTMSSYYTLIRMATIKNNDMGRFQVRGSPEGHGVVAFGQTKDIIRQILRADGLRGFYRGYVASLLTYIPNSAVWWPFYHFYAGKRELGG